MNSISGPYGFAYYASTITGHDNDDLLELFMDFDAIHYLQGSVKEDTLYFVLTYDHDEFPLFAVRGPEFSFDILPDELKQFLKSHAVFPFEADPFILDLRPYTEEKQYGGQKYLSITLDNVFENKDDIILAVYRFTHSLYYHD